MSWSISATGKPGAAIVKLKSQIHGKCTEPEETIRAKIVDIIDLCLGAYPAGHPVKVSASGSKSEYWPKQG
jgi:hypothetical protein